MSIVEPTKGSYEEKHCINEQI